MLIDHLEQNARRLREKEEQRLSLERQLSKFYSKDIKEEIRIVQLEIKKIKAGVLDDFYENITEYALLRKHFPELLDEYFSDPYIGKILSRKKWLLVFDGKKQKTAAKELEKIKNERKQLREARDFLRKWVGKVDIKSLAATWKPLKDVVKDGMERDEALQALHERNRQLRRGGWKFLLYDPLILIPLKRLANRLLAERKKAQEVLEEAEGKRGSGTVEEYKALSELKKAESSMMKTERMIRHLFVANMEFLAAMKKKAGIGTDRVEAELRKIASTVYVRKIEETEWLAEMRKKLS